MKKILCYSFISVLSLLGGITISGQLLGFLGFYYRWSAILLTIVLTIAFFYFLRKATFPILIERLNGKEIISRPVIENIAYVAGFGLLLTILIFPTASWPLSGVTQTLTWDAGVYHLPKAVELLTSHSTWDLSIAYGEYPWGYESLVAFSFIFSKAGYLIGAVHALIILFFVLSFFFISARLSKCPPGLIFFMVVFITCSFDLVRWFDSNPWWIFRVLSFMIGKNDLYLAAAILSLLVFSPIGKKEALISHNWLGMGLASALVLSIKPNGLVLVAYIWFVMLVNEISNKKSNRDKPFTHMKLWITSGIFVVIGMLWAIRNYFGQGELFSSSAMSINQWSIINNLLNPYFYNYLDFPIKSLLGVFIILVIIACFDKKLGWNVVLIYLVLFLSFIITPATAFFGSNQIPAQIDYRFGAYLLAFEFSVILMLLDPIISWVFRYKSKLLDYLLGIIVIVVAFLGCYINRGYLRIDQNNSLPLRDFYQDAVGSNGYHSAYDYIQENVQNSVVWVENGYPFYVQAPYLTNTVTREKPADYYVFFQTAIINSGGYPDKLDDPSWKKAYTLIYEDSEGRIYKRNE